MSTTIITKSPSEAYVTLVATDSYVQGAIVLGYSLRNLFTCKLLVCMVTSELCVDSVTHLSKVFDQVLFIEKLDTLAEDNLRLLGRPELGLTVSKIHIWSLTWLDTVLFLDADTLVLKPLDHLFEEYRNIPFAACPDPGWPDCFNSGVFICKPSSKVYEDLIQLLAVQGSFDGGDQGLLNAYFKDWSVSSEKRMPFIYNVTPNEVYSYAPAYKKHLKDIAVLHFIGKDKPWHQAVQNETSADQVTKEEWQEKITEKLLTKLENKPVQLFDQPTSSSKPAEFVGNKKTCLNRQDYVQKWWEVYRNSINRLSCIEESLTSQGKLENQDVEYQHSSINIKPQFNHQESNLLETHATLPEVYDNYNPHQLSYEFQTNSLKDKIHTQERETNQKLQSFQKKEANSRQVPEKTQVSYSFGHSSEQTTRLPFRVHPDEVKLKERPILPENALSDLAERQMLTPAHQQARDANVPFPLFEAYREPRRTKKTPQVNVIQTLPQKPKDLPENPTLSQKDASNLESTIVNLTGDSSPHSSTWPSTPANNAGYSGSGVSGVSGALAPHSRKIIDTLLANTVDSIPSDSPVSVKLTCVRSKSKMASNGTYSTTYKLVWEESGSQSQVSPISNCTFATDTQSLASTSGFMTPEPDSDNESVESLSVGSYPVTDVKVDINESISNEGSTVNTSLNQPHLVSEESNQSDSLKPTTKSSPLLKNSSDKAKLPVSISSEQLEPPNASKTIPNSASAGTQHSTTKLSSEFINQTPTSMVNLDRKSTRRTPIEYQQPRSSKDGFSNYRIQWNHSELRGWRPPQNIPTVSRYQDSEDPHDRRLRQRSTSEAAPNSSSTSPR